jgi:hypothetical protein
MKIHSDTLDFQQISSCVPNGCYLAPFDHPGFGRTRCGYEGSRSRARGFVVRLSGSHKVSTRGLPDKAATYDEWGNFLAAIFALDPRAICGGYDGRDDFIVQTDGRFVVGVRAENVA